MFPLKIVQIWWKLETGAEWYRQEVKMVKCSSSWRTVKILYSLKPDFEEIWQWMHPIHANDFVKNLKCRTIKPFHIETNQSFWSAINTFFHKCTSIHLSGTWKIWIQSWKYLYWRYLILACRITNYVWLIPHLTVTLKIKNIYMQSIHTWYQGIPNLGLHNWSLFRFLETISKLYSTL